MKQTQHLEQVCAQYKVSYPHTAATKVSFPCPYDPVIDPHNYDCNIVSFLRQVLTRASRDANDVGRSTEIDYSDRVSESEESFVGGAGVAWGCCADEGADGGVDEVCELCGWVSTRGSRHAMSRYPTTPLNEPLQHSRLKRTSRDIKMCIRS